MIEYALDQARQHELGLEAEASYLAFLAEALAGFAGVARRFQVLGEVDGATVVDVVEVDVVVLLVVVGAVVVVVDEVVVGAVVVVVDEVVVVVVLEDGVRAVNVHPEDGPRALQEMARLGAEIVNADALGLASA